MNQLAPARGRQVAEATDGEDRHKYLSFELGEDTYAVSILRVKEIIEYGRVTTVPMMPEFVRGAINLRGHVVPIVDLSRRLGLGETNISRWTCVVIVEVEAGGQRLDVGLTVDAVSRVWDIEPGAVEAAPSFGGKVRTDFMEGMAKVNEDSFVILLDIDNMLSMSDIEALASAARASGAESAGE